MDRTRNPRWPKPSMLKKVSHESENAAGYSRAACASSAEEKVSNHGSTRDRRAARDDRVQPAFHSALLVTADLQRQPDASGDDRDRRHWDDLGRGDGWYRFIGGRVDGDCGFARADDLHEHSGAVRHCISLYLAR